MVLTVFDLLLTPIYLLFIYAIASYIQFKNEKEKPLYKWYTRGVMVKMMGAIAVCMIYQFYYEGGDTTNYYETAAAVSGLLVKNSDVFLDVAFGGANTVENYTYFDENTGFPVFWKDGTALFVSRLLIPLYFVAFKSFVVMTLLLSWICFSGIWRLFILFNNQFPELQKQFAVSLLFIPSVVFWGSGLLKDTITISAVGWYTYHFYCFFIQKRYKILSFSYILIAAFLLVAIKPYIFFALLPGSLIWLSNERLATIKNKVLKYVTGPFFIAFGLGLSLLLLSQMEDFLGIYALDSVLDRAVVVNLDQKQEYYGGHSFDIGEFDASIGSMLGKAHLAIMATLFRPYLWDASNPVMLLSACENTYILLLTLFLLFKLKFFGFFTLIGKHPLLLFSVLFSLFFAFSVGIATSNFGSLVRLKIPCIPFYVSSLFVLKHFYEKKTKKKLGM
jgi:hypothetical protein